MDCYIQILCGFQKCKIKVTPPSVMKNPILKIQSFHLTRWFLAKNLSNSVSSIENSITGIAIPRRFNWRFLSFLRTHKLQGVWFEWTRWPFKLSCWTHGSVSWNFDWTITLFWRSIVCLQKKRKYITWMLPFDTSWLPVYIGHLGEQS